MMIPSCTIADRTIGPGHPPVIIAELGVNHDGDADKALQLVDAAASAGVDAIKTQIFDANLLLSQEASVAGYQEQAGETDAHEMLARLQLPMDAIAQIHKHARDAGLFVFSTIFSPELVKPSVESLHIDALKLASPDLVNKVLLDNYLATGLPMILSTGASTMEEVMRAVDWLGEARERSVLMQCVSAYPAPDAQASLGAIRDLEAQTRLPVGYSDHTTSTMTGALAVAAGAYVLEKHLTHDTNTPGPDHAASLNAQGMREYVRLARRAGEMLGASEKILLDIEEDVRSVSRQSLVLSQQCPRGTTITRQMLTTARPGTGIPPACIDDVVGKIAAVDLPVCTMLKAEHLVRAQVVM